MTMSAAPDPAAQITVRWSGLVRSELVKLKGSLVMTLSLAVPGLVLLLTLLMGLMGENVTGVRLIFGTTALWAQGMLPLGILALTVVLAQLEHQPRAWDPLLALPGTRRRIYLVKLAAAVVVLIAWHLILIGGYWLIVQFFTKVMPGQIIGPIPLDDVIRVMPRILGASLLMLVVQYALALYFRSFVPPLVIGFGGILFALGAYSSKLGVFLPWMMPINQLATVQWRVDTALGLGLGGGLIAAWALQIVMQRREW